MRFELSGRKMLDGIERIPLRSAQLQQRDEMNYFYRIASAAFLPSKTASSINEYFQAP